MVEEVVRGPVEPVVCEDGTFRSGWVALVGRPNVGKSTILNELLGEKLAAITPKPQTTRKNLLGVLNPKGAQLLLLDTPGHHAAKGPLNRFMVSQAEQAIADADVVAYVVEARDDGKITPGNERLLELLKKGEKKVVLLVNKVDRVKDKAQLLLELEAYGQALGELLAAAVPISARRHQGLEAAVVEIGRALPEGPRYFPEDQLTDATERSIVAEMIREKVMLVTAEELPYSAAVTIEAFEDERPRLVRIIATLHLERESQKPIVVGKRGEMVKSIGTAARLDIERFLGAKVYLDLVVRVAGEWSSSARAMAEFGYGADLDGGSGAVRPPLDAEELSELAGDLEDLEDLEGLDEEQ